ncbi:MAG: hypothetical protein PHV21_03435 [Synergistaceae bacterium]|nr:hypothetical protein [Synergistaceae bacterium]
MTLILYFAALFAAKVLDNTLSTAKTIFIQRSRCIFAGICLAASNFIYYWIAKLIVTSDGVLAILVVSLASGVGCCLAVAVNNRLSKEKTYVNVVMSDNREAMQQFRDFLAEKHITNVATDSYTRDWNTKTITVTAYADTKAQSSLINDYLESSPLKYKRVIQKA